MYLWKYSYTSQYNMILPVHVSFKNELWETSVHTKESQSHLKILPVSSSRKCVIKYNKRNPQPILSALKELSENKREEAALAAFVKRVTYMSCGDCDFCYNTMFFVFFFGAKSPIK